MVVDFGITIILEYYESKRGREPTGELSSAINDAFGSFDSMKEEFHKAAMTRFGSGWAWLCVSDGSLCILSTPNQDNPIMQEKVFRLWG